MNYDALLWFCALAVPLLGAPGLAIAALVAVGKNGGCHKGLRYFAGLQVGLAVAAGASALGLLSILQISPVIINAMAFIVAAYLIYLGYKVATAPLGAVFGNNGPEATLLAGVVLGLSNPLAYHSFAKLFAYREIVTGMPEVDILLKWSLCVTFMLLFGFAALHAGASLGMINVGVRLGRIRLPVLTERLLNYALGATMVAIAVRSVAFS